MAMGWDVVLVVTLVVKVLETFPEVFGEPGEVLDSLYEGLGRK